MSPRGLSEAASSALPARVRSISTVSAQSAPQHNTAVRISLVGVRTPPMSVTPVMRGRTVWGLVVVR